MSMQFRADDQVNEIILKWAVCENEFFNAGELQKLGSQCGGGE